jgi:putative methionine-R-sulfoxide reductase with GAF domain
VSGRKDKLVFDEQTLARVLEAAYVLQEHNRALERHLDLQSDQSRKEHAESAPPPEPSPTASEDKSFSKDDDFTLILAQIVDTHYQVLQLELEGALALVADRLTQIMKASGSAIGIVEGKIVRYQAASGTSALPQGIELPIEKALCFTSLRTGQVMRCADVNPEFLIDSEECHRRGIQSLIAVPVYRQGGIAGALELYFDKVNGFSDQDVHTCQLMAGLVTEAFARDAQVTCKKSLAEDNLQETVSSFGGNVPEVQVSDESVPYRYRIYVGATLAILIVAFLIMAYRGVQAAPGATPQRGAQLAAKLDTPPPAPVGDDGRVRTHADRKVEPKAEPPKSNAPPAAATQALPIARTPPSVTSNPPSVAANQGNGSEELLVAKRYLNGMQGKARDSTEAARWLWQAVRKKNTAATLLLSDLYLRGDGVQKNCDQALILLDAAGRKGAAGASQRLRNLQAFGCQ